MTLGQLKTFVEVARAGSIRGAAAALVVTEPSVSAAVGALSRELAVDLLERDGRGIRLTAAGEELAHYAAEILGLADRARRAAREAAGGPPTLRLVAATTAGEYVLPPILARFRERHPEIDISLEVGNRALVMEQLVVRQADLAVGGRPPSADVRGEAFLDNMLVVVSRPDHPLGARRAVDPSLLAGETWLVREPGSGTRETSEEFLAGHGITPRTLMTVGSNGAIKQAAAVGLGITLLSEHAVAEELAGERLVSLRVRGTPVRRSWYALYMDSTRLPRAAASFLEFLRSAEARRAVARAAGVPAT